MKQHGIHFRHIISPHDCSNRHELGGPHGVHVAAQVDDLRSEVRTLAAYQREEGAQQREEGAQQRKMMRIILKSQLRPTSSSVSTKRKLKYHETAIDYYYGVGSSQSSHLTCMITGDICVKEDLKAGHIYRQEWGAGLLVSEGKLMLVCTFMLIVS